MPEDRRIRRRFRGWGIAGIGVAALFLAAATYFRDLQQRRTIGVTASAGDTSGLRYQLLQALASEAGGHKLKIRLVETGGWSEMVDLVDQGTLDFALIQGGFDLTKHKNIREVAGLNLEPLHLLVKQEIESDVANDLRALKGKVVNLGSGPSTATYYLAQEVLSFAGLSGPSDQGPGDYRPTTFAPDELFEKKDRSALPDALFIVSTLPSVPVQELVRRYNFRLVPLPFDEAFALGALSQGELAPAATRSASGGAREDQAVTVLREHVTDVVIPRFTYQVKPPVPDSELHTLGTRLLLVSHKDTAPEAVYRVLDCIFNTRFAKVLHPPLDPKLLHDLPEAPWHRGTLAYLDRDKPLITGDFMAQVANAVQIGVPLLGSLFCLWQWFHQRSRFRRERSFESYIYKVTDIESRAMEIELAARIDLQSLISLQRDLERIKTDALRKFAEGEMEGAELLSSFLAHVNDARNYLTRLILHQRDSLMGQLRIPQDLHGFAPNDSFAPSMTIKPSNPATGESLG
jgi:TRAP-type uncharacterized transport system substrate-binding protein